MLVSGPVSHEFRALIALPGRNGIIGRQNPIFGNTVVQCIQNKGVLVTTKTLSRARRAVLAAAACSALVGFGANANAADIPLTYTVDMTTYLAKMKKTQTMSGTFNGTFGANGMTGTLNLPAQTMPIEVLGMPIANAQMQIVQVGTPTTTMTSVAPGSWAVNVTTVTKTNIKISSIRPAAPWLSWMNFVQPTCQTSTPVTQTLTGQIGLAKQGPGGLNDYTLKGTYTIPAFSNCGWWADGLVTQSISGPNNTVSVHFHK